MNGIMNGLTISDSEIESLKLNIENTKKEIHKLESILTYLESKKSLSIEAELPELKTTMHDHVLNAINLCKNKEFTISLISLILLKQGVIKDLNNKNNRSWISNIMRSLAMEGKIKRTFKGVGRLPSKYINYGINPKKE